MNVIAISLKYEAAHPANIFHNSHFFNPLVNNTLIKDINNLPKLLAKKDYFLLSGEQSYRPVVTFTYFVDYVLYGLKAWGYHLTNILLHALNGVLLYIFLTLIIQPSAADARQSTLNPIFVNKPFLISLIFAAHPVLTEAVNSISFREDLLVFLFYMATLIIYLSRPTFRSSYSLYVVSLFTYFLALLSKEMAITLPLVIYFYELIMKDRRAILPDRYNMGYFTVASFYLYLSYYFFSNPIDMEVPNWAIWKINERLLTLPLLFINYIKVTLFPVSLSADYELMPVSSITLSLLGYALIGFIVFLAIRLKQTRKEMTFGILFILVSLTPVYNLIPINNPFAERYLYLPVTGVAIIIGLLINFLLISPRAIDKGILAIFFIMLSFYSVTVINRNTVWETNYLLLSDTVKKMPNSNRGHFNLGLLYVKEGRFEKAMHEFKTVIKVNPYFADAHNALGNIYSRIGRRDDAISEYMLTLKSNPQHVEAHYNLGFLYLEMGLKDKAKKEFERVLKLNPDITMARRMLESIYTSTALP